MYKRALPPAHYSLKIQSFSLLSKSNVDKYDSGVFEVGGYKWSLSLYPNGDKDNNGSGFVSFYLSIEETDKLPHGWEVDVNYKLFVYDKIRDVYLTIQDADGAVRSFHDLKTQWGFAQFLSLETFKEASNGYLVGDSCISGAEVFVIKSTGKWESLSMIKDPLNLPFTWNIKNFSKLDKSVYYSDAFPIGESSWKLQVYPNGFGPKKGKSLSVYLLLVGNKDLPPKRRVYRECNLRVLDQLNDNHMEKKSSHWVQKSDGSTGFHDFMSLEDLHKPSKGFIYNDVLIVEVQILVVSVAKVVGV
ncbi:MATH domain and coiled-coil domain-containing protein At3g58410-like [Rhodamnia argentea]|uniref:MATH domain and coiled-coil domain-containing protein At3g58410-like n=1 Tax=Rhodamnia argentea TaxID=178133 RepID=A0ABM3HXB1_9MYRT|nr:MATH domain and coiled-coil domain-containing protein At3g58410-like [Rhodamnia argentea]